MNETPSPDQTEGSSQTKRHVIIGLVVAVVMLVADQAIKVTVEAELPFQQPLEVLPFFAMYYTFNTGVAFSFMNNLSPTTLLLIAGTVVAIMLFLWWQARHDGLLPAIGFGMILGGAVGNIIDRALYGHVIDYVLLHWGDWSFAIFNLADAALTIGVALIIFANLFLAPKGDQ